MTYRFTVIKAQCTTLLMHIINCWNTS